MLRVLQRCVAGIRTIEAVLLCCGEAERQRRVVAAPRANGGRLSKCI